MTTNPTAVATLARDLIRATRANGDTATDLFLDVIRPECLPDLIKAMTGSFVRLTGPDTITEEDVRSATLCLLGAVEAALDGDASAVETLRPETLAEGLAQANAAVVILANLLGQDGGRDWIAGFRADMLRCPTDPEETETDD
ncbi:hypothetical protein [Mobilicoccus massiliensis]|uniref:hypothetical protein n=1 Tax=Mobilicoccus massiliensis TaxID=1522310 RepID=UPI00058BBCCC|nr:hypothetical protein [Mobilicoccus massiliensis]